MRPEEANIADERVDRASGQEASIKGVLLECSPSSYESSAAGQTVAGGARVLKRRRWLGPTPLAGPCDESTVVPETGTDGTCGANDDAGRRKMVDVKGVPASSWDGLLVASRVPNQCR